MEKPSMDELKNQLKSEIKLLSKKSLLKWIVFVGLVYAMYDAVFLRADSMRLMLDLTDISSGLVPKIMLNIDVPLMIGIVLLCILFAKRNVLSALALRTKKQIVWMILGVVVFVFIIYMQRPSGMIDAYEIIHALVVTALLEELVFRGILFHWMEQTNLHLLAYIGSGLAWGGLLGIHSMVVGGASAIGAIVPMALMGIVVGTVYALIYKKTNSLWLVIYLHAALSLL